MITSVQFHDAASRIVDKIRQDADLGSINFIVIVTDKVNFAKLTDLQETEQVPVLMSVIRTIDPSIALMIQLPESLGEVDSEGEGKKDETLNINEVSKEDVKV